MNPENPESYNNPFQVQKPDDDMEGSSLKLGTGQEGDHSKYTPIKALCTNMMDWIIKARVTKKYERKSWTNARGKGYLMNIDLCDAYGSQIQATMFKEAVDKFDPVLK
jgi:ssDNA-binding replication factor A large subunit